MGRILPQGSLIGTTFCHPRSRGLYLVGFEVPLPVVLGGCNPQYWYRAMDTSLHVTNKHEYIRGCE